MKMVQIKKLGLSVGQQNKLVELKEQEDRIHEIAKTYDKFWLDKELKELNDQIGELEKKREAAEKKLAESDEQNNILSHRLKVNRQNQTAIVMQFGVLGKLAKVINNVKKIEKIIEAEI